MQITNRHQNINMKLMNLQNPVGQFLLAGTLCIVIALVWYFLKHPVMPFVLGALPLAIYFILRKPFWVCLFFILFSFFRLHEAFPVLNPLHIPQLLAIAALFTLSWHVFLSNSIHMSLSPELKWFLVFFFVVTFGLMFAEYRPGAISAWTGNYVKVAIMVFAISWLVQEKNDFSLALRLIVTCGILIAIVALQNKANGIGLVEGTRVTIGREIDSILGDPNDLALVLLFPVSFAVSMATTKGVSKFDRMLGIIGFLLCVAGIIATQSRGGLLGITSIIGMLAFRKIKSKTVVLVMGGLLLVFLVSLAGIAERSSGGAAEEGIDESAMGRIHAWETAWNMALSNPLTGVGLRNYTENYYAYTEFWDGKNHAVHSTWFEVLAETGFVGFIIFIILIVVILKSIITSMKFLDNHILENNRVHPGFYAATQAVLLGLISFMVSGTFLTQAFTWPLYILLALTAAIRRGILADKL